VQRSRTGDGTLVLQEYEVVVRSPVLPGRYPEVSQPFPDYSEKFRRVGLVLCDTCGGVA
jgi:hypothetical protein